jgi:hypothetical protein
MNPAKKTICSLIAWVFIAGCTNSVCARVPPSTAERLGYTGILAAADRGDAKQIKTFIAKGEKLDAKDGYGEHLSVTLSELSHSAHNHTSRS